MLLRYSFVLWSPSIVREVIELDTRQGYSRVRNSETKCGLIVQ